MIDLLGAAVWILDRWGGRRLGGKGLKILWLAFFAKLAVPFGLLALVPWSAAPVSAPGSPMESLVPTLLGNRPVDAVTLLAPAGAVPTANPFPWETALALLLAVPAVLFLILLAVRVVQAGSALSKLPEVGGVWKLRTDSLARNLGIRRPVRLLRSPKGTSPASWDLFRPAILIPQEWEDRAPDAELEQILLHELVHLKNRDPLIGLAVQVLTCLYWFHPLVWVARNRLLASLEAACDQKVLGFTAGAGKTVYCQALFRVLELSVNRSLIPGTRAAAADKNALKRRILMIRDFHPRRRNGAVLTLLAAVFLTTVSLVPAGSETPPDPSSTGRLVDDIHRPFVDDGAVKGVWKVVDFVNSPSDFVFGKTSWTAPLYLKSLTFYPNGKMGVQADEELPEGPLPWFSWTKGVVMHQNDVTASAYTIEWRGFFTDVMFFEWKSGDYTIRHMKPKYYVLMRG